jgi:DNA-binding transcriptional regulator YiaG
MPNIQSLLKSEIARIARKEVRAETEQLKKSSTQYRSQIAALKRTVAALEKQLKRQKGRAPVAAEAEGESAEARRGFRFSAKGLAAQRRRLGLSAREVALLLGVSALSVYKWEQGKARPRARQLEAIARLRGMGKKEAAAKVSAAGG